MIAASVPKKSFGERLDFLYESRFFHAKISYSKSAKLELRFESQKSVLYPVRAVSEVGHPMFHPRARRRLQTCRQ